MKFTKVLFLFIILWVVFQTAFALAANTAPKQTSPILITDFDSPTRFKEFFFSGPQGEKVDFKVQHPDADKKFIHQGARSCFIRWNFANNEQYGGWGIDLRNVDKEGFDASQVTSLTFWVIGVSGGEGFQIKLKDAKGNEPELVSQGYFTDFKEWQQMRIPLAEFGKKIDFTRLENINLGFSPQVSGDSGAIYVDDFKFEFTK